MQFDPERLDAFIGEFSGYKKTDHKKICDIFNKPLYVAFQEHHAALAKPNPMKALFLLLDKSYSAGLRRSYREDKDSVEASIPVDTIVDRLCDGHATPYRRILRGTNRLGSTLRLDNVPAASELVESLCSLLTEVGGRQRHPLSFASKFLHFYSGGVVPIWDRLARSGLAALIGGKSFSKYEDYAKAFACLCCKVYGKNCFSPCQVKLVDNCLIWKGANWGP